MNLDSDFGHTVRSARERLHHAAERKIFTDFAIMAFLQGVVVIL